LSQGCTICRTGEHWSRFEFWHSCWEEKHVKVHLLLYSATWFFSLGRASNLLCVNYQLWSSCSLWSTASVDTIGSKAICHARCQFCCFYLDLGLSTCGKGCFPSRTAPVMLY
jgi:hypothetical protein